MRKFRTFVLVALLSIMMMFSSALSVGCCHHRVNPDLGFNIPEQISSHLLSIQIQDSHTGDKYPVGSGTYIELDGSPYVLTAFHVWGVIPIIVENNTAVACYTHDNCVELVVAPPMAYDPGEDWAIVSMPSAIDGMSPAPISNKQARLGEEVWAAGHPDSIRTVVHGTIAGHTTLPGEPFMHYIVDGYAYFGSSGGGLFNAKGELIGIMEAIDVFMNYETLERTPNPNLFYCVPVLEIPELLVGTVKDA